MIDKIVSEVVDREGGYVDNPADTGGPTNFGITQATLAAWRGVIVTPSDVQAMPRSEAEAIYKDRYYHRPGYDAIKDEKLAAIVVDCAVQFWTDDATAWLQLALGVTADGKIGPATLAALEAADPRTVAVRIMAYRIRRRGHRITAATKKGSRVPDQSRFAEGWADRDADFLESVA